MSKHSDRKTAKKAKFNEHFPYKRDPFIQEILPKFLAFARREPFLFAITCEIVGLSPSTIYKMALPGVDRTRFPQHRTFELMAVALGLTVERKLVRKK